MAFADNIVTDYGAVADGEWAEGVFTISAGNNVLTGPSALWSAPDVGKTIVVGRCGGGALEPQGGTALRTTISSVGGGGTTVTLGANAVSALPNAADATVLVSWGTNNATAFENFRTTREGLDGTLTIPTSGTGVYVISSGNFGGLFHGVTDLTVTMTGATIAGSLFQIGSGAEPALTSAIAQVASVSAGADRVTCLTAAHASRFPVGKYTMLSGFCLQYAGYPSNHQRFEYLLVTGADAGTGVVTFSTPLVNSYLSTWPNYNPGSMDGGPATLYAWAEDPSAGGGEFGQTLVVNGGTIVHHAQWGVYGHSVTLNDMTFEGLYGPYPTMAGSIAFNNCNASDCTMEVDKHITSFTLTSCIWGGIACQSSSTTTFTLDNTDIAFSLAGVTYDTIIRNGCSIGTLTPGPASGGYGFNHSLTVSDSVISNFATVTYHDVTGQLIKGANGFDNGINVDCSMAGGIITIPSSFYDDGYMEKWATTGKPVFFFDGNVGTIQSFTITDVTQTGSDVLVHTNLTGGFPPRSYYTGKLWMLPQVAPVCTFSNVTGCPEVVDLSNTAAQGVPLYSYSKRTYDNTTGTGEYWQLYGKIKYIKVTVTELATQVGTVTATLGNTCVKASDFTDISFVPVINMKAGLNVPRILDCRNAASTGTWVGGQTGDSLPDITEAIWSGCNFRCSMTTPLVGPGLVEVEYITDQGFEVTEGPPEILMPQACM